MPINRKLWEMYQKEMRGGFVSIKEPESCTIRRECIKLEGAELHPRVGFFLQLERGGDEDATIGIGVRDGDDILLVTPEERFPLAFLPNSGIHAQLIVRLLKRHTPEKLGDALLSVLVADRATLLITVEGKFIRFRLQCEGFWTETDVPATDLVRFINVL